MTIESHGQIFTSHSCPTCGAKCKREIDAKVCQKKHELTDLLIQQCGQDMAKLFNGSGSETKRIRAIDHADEIKQRKARKVKPLRGANIPEGKL